MRFAAHALDIQTFQSVADTEYRWRQDNMHTDHRRNRNNAQFMTKIFPVLGAAQALQADREGSETKREAVYEV